MTDEQRPEENEDELNDELGAEVVDPIEDEEAGEAESAAEAEIEDEADAVTEAEDEAETEGADEQEADEVEAEFKAKPRPPVKLERLQKILAQAGVASRRKAEEMIEQGRVQVNGKVVTELGTKADGGRDHIRVDGKLLQGAERLRYFVLNKPRGFVTTVKDPEGRPTVMQFFEKMRERLYPVGRLDYLSEGLLLVTNDGELAHKLTRAAAGVEKTYLVKVAGVPTESELDILRAGVSIAKGKAGSDKVRTSPARIRQVRQGDNPWYEVVLIEGRNRELRKMFEEIGHFVEKIRRVGYGPLVLDQEPGNLRELDEQEMDLLRKAADGKWKTPKAKEVRRRNIVDSLPPDKPAFKPRGERPAAGPKDYQPKRSFGADRPARSGARPAKFGAGRPADSAAPRPAWKKDDRPSRPAARFGSGPAGEARPATGRSFGDKPAGKTFGARPPAGRTFGGKPAGKPFGSKPAGDRPYGERPAAGRGFPAKPAWKKPEAGERPSYKKPFAKGPEAGGKPGFKKPFAGKPETRRPAPKPVEDFEPTRPSRLRIEPVQDFERTPRPERSGPPRPSSSRPPSGRPGARPSGPRSAPFGRTSSDRPAGGRSSSARPFRSEGGLARPFTTSSGKPRPGGARPSSKPGREGGRPSGAGGGRGGPAKSGYRGKPGGSGGRSSGPRPGGKRPGGKRP